MDTTPSPKPTFNGCIACDIISGKKEIPGGSLLQTQYFDIHQDFAVPIPGFLIIVPLRHVNSIEEFSDEEAAEFGVLLKRMRVALSSSLGISLVHLLQDENSPHFHLAMLPLYEWMKEQFGEKVQSTRPIMDYAKAELNTPEHWAEIIQQSKAIQHHLLTY